MTLDAGRSIRLMLVLGLLAACEERATPTFPAVVRVESDPGVRVAGAAVLRDGAVIGTTDATGLVRFTLYGSEGELVTLRAQCADDFESPPELSVRLRRSVDGKAPEHLFVCAPRTRSVVVAVRTVHGEGLPLLYLGQPIAKTDAFGVAHALVRARPSESLELTLDTSARPRLRPQNPSASYVVKSRDDTFLFEQTFVEERPPVVRVVMKKPTTPKRLSARE